MYGIRDVEKRSKISFMTHFHEFPSFIIIFSCFHQYLREISRPDLTDTVSNAKKSDKDDSNKRKSRKHFEKYQIIG